MNRKSFKKLKASEIIDKHRTELSNDIAERFPLFAYEYNDILKKSFKPLKTKSYKQTYNAS